MEAGNKPPTGSNPVTPPPTTGSQPALGSQTPAQQIEGLRAWIAQVDRRLGIRTYALGAAVVLALAAGIVGVVLATSAKDESATKAEVAALRDQVSSVGREASQAAEDDVASLSDRIDDLEGRVATIASNQRTSDSELKVAQDDIDDLRSQLSDLESEVQANAAASTQDLGNDDTQR